MAKSCTIRCYSGCGKSWSMQHKLLHALSKGLFALPSAQIPRRSVFIGIKHIDWLFALPFEKGYREHQKAEGAMEKLLRSP